MAKAENVNAIDWYKIETEYIQSHYKDGGKYVRPSCAYLEKKYHLNPGVVAKECKKQNWVKKREKYWQEVKTAVLEEKKNALVDRAVQFDTDLFIFSEKIVELITDRVTVKRKNGELDINRNVSTLEIQRVTNIAHQIQQVKEKAVGDLGGADESSLDELCGILKGLQEK